MGRRNCPDGANFLSISNVRKTNASVTVTKKLKFKLFDGKIVRN